MIATPPDPKMGDYSFPCFTLAKSLKTSPNQIASDLAGRIEGTQLLERIESAGPYVNFFVNKQRFAKEILQSIR